MDLDIREMFPSYGKSAKTPYSNEEKIVGVAKVWVRGGDAKAYMSALCAKHGTKLGPAPKQHMSQWPKLVHAQLQDGDRETIVLCIREKIPLPQSIKAKIAQLQADNDPELAAQCERYGVTINL